MFSGRRPGIAATVLLAAGILFVAPQFGASAATLGNGSSTQATQWLLNQGLTRPASAATSFTQWDLRIETILALSANGQGGSAAARSGTDALLPHMKVYLSGGQNGATLVGPASKALVLSQVRGLPPTAQAVLEVTLRRLMQGQGRFSDAGPGFDSSNGETQAWALLALARTHLGAPAAGMQFLLKQQCPAGGFPLTYQTGSGCQSDRQADPLSTALAIQALHRATPGSGSLVAKSRAAVWLSHQQDSQTGALPGPNGNGDATTTGLAAVALREAGLVSPAARAQHFVASLQLRSGRDAGAIVPGPGWVPTPGSTVATNRLAATQASTVRGLFAFGLPGYDAVSLAVIVRPGGDSGLAPNQAGQHARATGLAAGPGATDIGATSAGAVPGLVPASGIASSPSTAPPTSSSPAKAGGGAKSDEPMPMTLQLTDSSHTWLWLAPLLVVALAALGWLLTRGKGKRQRPQT
jgi:hypothetical protein